MITIQNVSREGGYVKDGPSSPPPSSLMSGVGQYLVKKFIYIMFFYWLMFLM